MKGLELPRDQWAPAWGGLFGAVPVAWIFWAPYQKHADLIEWVLTAVAYIAFLAIYLLYIIYWSRKKIVMGVCIAMTILAIIFTAYRPSGVVFFLFVSALVPFLVNGKFYQSTALLAGSLLIMVFDWWLFWPIELLLIVVGILSLVLGAGTTFAARQQITYAHANRVDERERIARDLHDILGHTLSVIIVKAELASRLIERNVERAKKEIDDVEQLSRKALSEVREAISGYRTTDFYSEIERAKSALTSANIRAEIHCDIVKFSVAQERELTFILREAITNIIRHAEATLCTLSLKIVKAQILLEIKDNGRGGRLEEGSGMRGMRERIATIGGEISWHFDSGTRISISLPFKENAHA